ncbi:MAG: hypothetical protein GY757_35980 [bacterium]|nr:hypothetical protein [bacterium]
MNRKWIAVEYQNNLPVYNEKAGSIDNQLVSGIFTALSQGYTLHYLPVDTNGDNKEAASGQLPSIQGWSENKGEVLFNSRLDDNTREKIQKIIETKDIYLSTIMFAAFNILISHLTGWCEIDCDAVFYGNTTFSDGGQIYLKESLLLSNHIDNEETFENLLLRLKTDAPPAFCSDIHPLEKMFGNLKIHPADMTFAFQMLGGKGDEGGNGRFDKAAIEMIVKKKSDIIELNWTSKNESLGYELVKKIAGGFDKLLEQVIAEV